VAGLVSGGLTPALVSHDAAAAVGKGAAIAVPASGNERMLAATLLADGLTYQGLHSVSSSAGPVDVLRFTLDSGTATGVQMASVCVGGHTLVQTASGNVTLGTSTLDVHALSATVAGAAVSFTPASPPTAAFPSPVELDEVDADLNRLTSGAVTMSGAAMTIAAC
jgi:hypothetical protein